LIIDGNESDLEIYYAGMEDVETPSYITWSGALHNIYLLGLGEFETDDYSMGS
jgi:hypothetical protein